MKKTLLSLTLLLFAFAAYGQRAAVDRICDMAQNDNRVMQHLDILTNRFGGRPIGSDAYENAQAWAVRCFKEWGYEVKLERVGELACGFNRGPWQGRMLGEESMTLHFATPSYTVGTHGVERGHVLKEPRTVEELNRMRGALKGAWVLVRGKSRGVALAHGEKARAVRDSILEYNAGVAERYAEVRRNGTQPEKPEVPDNLTPALLYDQMIEAGVRGFIQSSDVPITALYDREVVHGGIDFDHLPAVPDIKLDHTQYDRIADLVRERRHVELEFDIRNHFKIGPVPYHNLVATIRGAKYPDQYVLVGAHLDSYDVATGGVDCGSGVSVVMEAARMIAQSGARPDRTIVFILFAGEEFGLLGSAAWAEQHKELLPKISNMFNRDGGPMPYTGFWAPGSLVKEYDKTVETIRNLYPDYPFTVEAITPHQKPRRTGGNDASTFSVLGVPASQMNEWNDVKGSNFSYYEIWHTDRDTYSKSIPEYQRQAAATMALVVLQTANLSKPFPREEVYLPDEE